MREIQASEAKTNLPRILTAVERGETVIITRHGRAIARIVPENLERDQIVYQALERLEKFRKTMPSLTLDEILSARHEGHKY
jgi:prevent-host-death family protein